MVATPAIDVSESFAFVYDFMATLTPISPSVAHSFSELAVIGTQFLDIGDLLRFRVHLAYWVFRFVNPFLFAGHVNYSIISCLHCQAFHINLSATYVTNKSQQNT